MADIYPLLPIAAGIAVMYAYFRHALWTALLMRNGLRAEGEVVGYAESNTTARMIVRFTTHLGEEVHAQHESTGWTASKHGETVTVTYHPNRPEVARIVDAPWLSNWVHIMFAVVGAVLIVVGLYLGYLRWIV
ncbi:DUF3592 domain-containing protein [Nocardiopsis chromatogenes]|uniref:DUF3592 domain-containing protein n=1 Tax=Nocardiopsis chromatogenes TaxID=280239 RepID=UPI00034AAFB3|nr:DUF3592 domain-containing protein [Nocardiopsis chromatogenes]